MRAAFLEAPNRMRRDSEDPMAKDIQRKLEEEKEIVSQMIALYCAKHHGGKDELCPECAEVDAYARARSDACPVMETKTFCSNCPVHCYKRDMRERICEIMRYAGPRMIYVRPYAALRYVIAKNREKRRLEKAKRR